MKRTILTTAFLMAVVFGVFANEITPSFAAPISDKSFSVSLSKWKSTEVEISIVDQFGTVVISETVSPETNKARVYNMKFMEDGNYTVVVEDATKTSKQAVTLDAGSINVGVDSKTFYKPMFKYDNDLVKINYLALGNKVSVKLIDSEGNLLYNEKFENEAAINKALNIKSLQSGFYYASITTEDATYTFDVIK